VFALDIFSIDCHWRQFIAKNIITFSVTFGLIYFSSVFMLSYTVFDGRACWYFPVGIELILFIFFPFRYWPIIILSISLSINFSNNELDIFTPLQIVQEFLHEIWNRAIPLLAIVFLKLRYTYITFTNLKVALAILGAALIYRLLRISYLYFIAEDMSLYGGVLDENLFELFTLHITTGFAAIFVVFVLFFTIYEFPKHWRVLSKKDRISLVCQVMICLAVGIILYLFNHTALDAIKMIAFIPIIWFAYRFGWLGTMSFTSCMLLLILYFLYNGQDSLLLEFQPFIISYSLVAIMVGAVIHENNEIKVTLNVQNADLRSMNDNLTSLNDKNLTLVKQLQSVQESERKMLSQALHDELGQNLTAFKLSLEAFEQRHALVKQQTSILKQSANAIYASVYDLMHWLRPRVLDDQGLTTLVKGDYFRKKLQAANIEYIPNVGFDLDVLPDEQVIAVFRIVQEAITNTIKHSVARKFYLCFTTDKSSLLLILSDDGIPQNSNAESIGKGQHGIEGIRERVAALSGRMTIDQTSGFKITISLPLM